MKKLLICLLALILALSLTTVTAEDYSALSREELMQRLDKIVAELIYRNYDTSRIICQADGVTLFLDDISMKLDRDGYSFLKFTATAVNTGNEYIGFFLDSVKINGIPADTMFIVHVYPGECERYEYIVDDPEETLGIFCAEDVHSIHVNGFSMLQESYEDLTDIDREIQVNLNR